MNADDDATRTRLTTEYMKLKEAPEENHSMSHLLIFISYYTYNYYVLDFFKKLNGI